ncbi:MAG: GNAT family N-acetyltransferase [Galactobacter sp.]
MSTYQRLRSARLDQSRPADVAALGTLLTSDPAHSLRINSRDPVPEDAIDVLTSRPPGLDPTAKVDLGLWDETGELAAFADVLRAWPRPDVAHIGLLFVHGAHGGAQLGLRMHREVLSLAASWPGIHRLRIGIVETNADVAEPFWATQGYTPTGETSVFESGPVVSRTRIWEREAGVHALPGGLERMIRDGLASEPKSSGSTVYAAPLVTKGSVSDLVAKQRR